MTDNPRRKMFATDPTRERDGVVISFGDMRLRLARAGGANKRFETALEEMTRPYRRLIANEVLPSDVALKIIKDVYAETVVLELEDYDNSDPKNPRVTKTFTREEIRAEFDEPDYGAEFYSFVQAEANKLANFKAAQREADQKN